MEQHFSSFNKVNWLQNYNARTVEWVILTHLLFVLDFFCLTFYLTWLLVILRIPTPLKFLKQKRFFAIDALNSYTLKDEWVTFTNDFLVEQETFLGYFYSFKEIGYTLACFFTSRKCFIFDLSSYYSVFFTLVMKESY